MALWSEQKHARFHGRFASMGLNRKQLQDKFKLNSGPMSGGQAVIHHQSAGRLGVVSQAMRGAGYHAIPIGGPSGANLGRGRPQTLTKNAFDTRGEAMAALAEHHGLLTQGQRQPKKAATKAQGAWGGMELSPEEHDTLKTAAAHIHERNEAMRPTWRKMQQENNLVEGTFQRADAQKAAHDHIMKNANVPNEHLSTARGFLAAARVRATPAQKRKLTKLMDKLATARAGGAEVYKHGRSLPMEEGDKVNHPADGAGVVVARGTKNMTPGGAARVVVRLKKDNALHVYHPAQFNGQKIERA